MVTENGLRFAVDFTTGHKTGFFLDQRENRALAAGFCAGKSVLDLCCYTGGFSLSAAAGGAARVTGVDLDEKAIVLARSNATLNILPAQGRALEFIHADVFEYLRGQRQTGERADVVILDPPKLAHTREDMPRAETMYADFNRLAAQSVKPSGALITCSCSGLVSEERFRAIVARAVEEAGRKMEVLEMRGAAADHPVVPEFPEGKYLKALFVRIS
jgi:23S rRNA (cytosine1962-C5)-methyltransferase